MKILSVFNKKDLKVLRKISKNVVDLSTIENLVFNMKEALENSGGIGISAVQIGVLKRVILVNTAHGDTVLINPEIVEEEGKVVSKEGCLSINGFYENVERSKTIIVKYINEKGDYCMQGFNGIDSICVQHEIDHLNGVLFFDKVNFMAKKRFKKLLKEKKNENRK